MRLVLLCNFDDQTDRLLLGESRMRPEAMIGIVAGISSVYVALILFVAYIARRLESKLIVMGLLTAAASVAYGSLVGGVSMHVAGQGVSTQLSGGSLPEMLMRLGIILVLAGVGLGCSTHCCPSSPPPPPSPEMRSPQP